MLYAILRRWSVVLIALVAASCSEPLMEVHACITSSQLGLMIKRVEHWYGDEQPKIQSIDVVQYNSQGLPINDGPVWSSRLQDLTESTGTRIALILYGRDPDGFRTDISARPLHIGGRYYAFLEASGYKGGIDFILGRDLPSCR